MSDEQTPQPPEMPAVTQQEVTDLANHLIAALDQKIEKDRKGGVILAVAGLVRAAAHVADSHGLTAPTLLHVLADEIALAEASQMARLREAVASRGKPELTVVN